MADFDSALPIRTESAGDVVVKIADATVPAQQLAVESDGSINVNATLSPSSEVKITDGTDTLEVNADGSLNAVVTATNLDIRDLDFASDSVDVSGSSVTVTATDLDIRDLAFATDKVDVSGSSVTVTATDLDIRDLAFATDSVDVSGSSVTVSATDLDIRDLDFATDSVDVSGSSVAISDGSNTLVVNSDGSLNVQVTNRNGSSSIADYNTATVASNATSTQTYTSTGNFYLEQVQAAASGKLKIEVQVNGATKFVGFNSSANPNIPITLAQPILATNAQTVTIIRTNLDNQSQDVYSTIVGYLA